MIVKILTVSLFFFSALSTFAQISRFDLNLDNRVSISDVTCLTNHLLGKESALLEHEGRIILHVGNDSIYLPTAKVDSITFDLYTTDNVSRICTDTVRQTVILPFADMPTGGQDTFTYSVTTKMQGDQLVTSADYGFIRLPETYTATGQPTKLIILCHGAGAYINGGSGSDGDAQFTKMLQAQGYAVLCFDGLPFCLRNSLYLTNENKATHFGGPAFMNCANAVYDYIMNKYNLDRNGVFLLGRSMGGGAALNLAFNSTLPIKGLALDAPAIDFYLGAYFNGMWGETGSLEGWIPAMYAWVYQWDYCDFEAATYTIPAATYTISSKTYKITSTQTKSLADLKSSDTDMAILWYLNNDKMVGYNPYKTNDYLYKAIDSSYSYPVCGTRGYRTHVEDNEHLYYQKKLPCPCKIWVGGTDDANCPKIDQRFVTKCKNANSIIELVVADTEYHMLWDRTTDGNGNDWTIDIDGLTCSKYAKELLEFIKLQQF